VSKVISLWAEEIFYATCPNCNGREWLLRLNGVGLDWDALTGSECAGCGFIVTWIFVDKEEDNAKGV
jgi:hypothetical protein